MRALVVIALAFTAVSTLAQRPPSTSETERAVTAQEKAALIRIARHFTRDMQRTRDVGPLIPRYFLPKVDYWWQMTPEGVTIGKYEGAKPSEFARIYRAETNMFYLLNVGAAIPDDSEFRTRVEKLVGFAPEDRPPNEFLRALRVWEQEYRRVQPYLRRKNVERTDTFKQYVKNSKCPYNAEREELGVTYGDVPKAFRKRFPATTPIYRVETPIGFTLIFVKYRNTFKLLLTGPCPWD